MTLMKKLTHEELVKRQDDIRQNGEKLPFIVVLNNIRSLYNVGSIFRTADGVGVEKIWLCGITGTPPDPKIAKTALGAENTVLWEYSWGIAPVLKKLKESGYQIVLLEQTKESKSYEEFTPSGAVCLVVGNEVDGISDEVLALCDQAVEIEMVGLKNSLNVTVALGIVAYHIRNLMKKTNAGKNK
jgi:tRNA G18 (ribose-2'-O)-methylase SpoU